MDHRARILATIAGEATDRPPVALWRHFPVVDVTAEGLADAVVAFQRAHDFDLVKVTPASGRPAEAWGARLEDGGNEEGTRIYLERAVTSRADWRALAPLDVTAGVLGEELRALELIRAGVGPDVPVLQTVFSPLTVAKQLAGERVWRHVNHHRADLAAGLAIITDTMARFSAACLEHGADGIFFATQMASRDLLDEETHEELGAPYDLAVLEAVRGRATVNVLHLHGKRPIFEVAARYGTHIVNWHDRETSPNLGDGLGTLEHGAVLGGLQRRDPLLEGTPDAVREQARDALRQTGGRRTIIGTGCVTLVPTPEANLRAARRAVEDLPTA